MFVSPQWDVVDHAVRILGWPTFLSIVIWAVRKYDAGESKVKALTNSTLEAVKGITEVKADVAIIKSNHLMHLQTGIESLAASGKEQVEVLKEIKAEIQESSKATAVLLDRVQR